MQALSGTSKSGNMGPGVETKGVSGGEEGLVEEGEGFMSRGGAGARVGGSASWMQALSGTSKSGNMGPGVEMKGVSGGEERLVEEGEGFTSRGGADARVGRCWTVEVGLTTVWFCCCFNLRSFLFFLILLRMENGQILLRSFLNESGLNIIQCS